MRRRAVVGGLALGILLGGCGTAVQPGSSAGGGKGAFGQQFGSAQQSSTPFGPAGAKDAHCGDLKASDAPNFFKISGIRVALPPDNPLARDRTLVQPGSVPIAHYGIAVDDGTGVCAVYMPNPPVAIGGHLSLVVQAVRSSGGGVWLGWVNVPA
jgi:hypothetical protein